MSVHVSSLPIIAQDNTPPSIANGGTLPWFMGPVYNGCDNIAGYSFMYSISDQMPSPQDRTTHNLFTYHYGLLGYAYFYTFGWPHGTVIDGIQVSIRHMAGTAGPLLSSGTIKDKTVQLVKNSSLASPSIVGSNKAKSNNWANNNWETFNYGGPTDLWGTSWTPAEIQDIGLVVAADAHVVRPGLMGAIDCITLTVFFTYPRCWSYSFTVTSTSHPGPGPTYCV